ncbi:hypothetical protein LCGC14_0341170 [marine sediment metagenome]|uniref:Glycosyltransferase subfamily 4-like N-terminal domain-containing protein n=1 Tax=marine sediment metagenome TaxID=412755 RepID=A0A0F9TDM6_9ZZZZ
MKILQVFDFLSLPHGGGTVDVVNKLSQALTKRGHEVTICIGDYELDKKYLETLGNVKIRMFHSWFNRYGFYIMPSLVKLDVKEFDVIHFHCYRSFQNIVICSSARLNNIPYMIDAHGSTVELPGAKRIIKKLYDMLFGHKDLKYASMVIAETAVGIAEYEKLGVNAIKARVIHPLLDIGEFKTLPEAGLFRAKYHIKERCLILFVGRIHWAKGLEILFKAIEGLENIRLVIVGQDAGFQKTLERLGSSKILFTGFLEGKAKLSAFVDADVLVQPSRNEAGVRPSLEAILCGTPVIVTKDTGAGKEIAKMDGGYLVDYGNVGMLRDAIKYILKNPEEAKEKTQKAKSYIKSNLSIDKQIVQYEELYTEAVG